MKHLTSKIKEQNQIVQYYENMSCEQQGKTNLVEKNIIQTFKNGKYTEEICQVYYEMLRRNVSVDKCGDLLKVILKEVAQINVDRVPQKSLAATMFAEMETLSKIHVQEELLKGQKNVLHTDGTKYNFEEVVGFQISTGSGSFTLGIEPMRSGEVDSYFETFKHMLEDISYLVVPEEQVDQDVREVLTSFKALMTDHTIMNSAFLKKFSYWTEECLPFVVKNYVLPDDEKEKISNIHHVFCGLCVLHNLHIYAEKSLID